MEAPDLTSKEEIINIQIGKAGNAIAHEFWRDLCEEHDIHYKVDDTKGQYHPQDDFPDHLHVFFNEGSRSKEGAMRWVPRSILMDLNMSDLSAITQDPLGDLYRPENIIGNDEGSGNCYAKAFHTDGPELADQCLEMVRKEVERCNCLQGIQFVHSISGGTGSGLTGLVMSVLRDYLDGDKCIMQNFSLLPSPGQSDMLVEPYNAALSLSDIIQHSDQCFVFDNAALTDICQKALRMNVPKMISLNNIIALCMSGITSGLRFTGRLNVDLRKMHVNLVPYKRMKFLMTSFAPLGAEDNKKYRQVSAQDLAQQMMSKENVTCKVDPQHPGSVDQGIMPARFLASWAAWRGNWQTSDVDQIIHDIWKERSRYDKFFPDWIPNPIGSNICEAPHCEVKDSVIFASNNTAVANKLKEVRVAWDQMFKAQSYLHVFTNEGLDKDELKSSADNMLDCAREYDSLADHPDKILGIEGSPHDQYAIEQELLQFQNFDGSDKEVMCLGRRR
jgi:tubulin beta